jgi:capsular exopolysaccharide synthesis family protein
MSAPDTFSIAVVRGPAQGQVLRTDRKRISVGRGEDNDLIVQDRDIAARHFLILIDHGRWRIHTLTSERSLAVDRRWRHPATGKRGAVIRAGSTELIVYPGNLESSVVDREVQLRSRGERPDDLDLPEDELDEASADLGFEDAGTMPTIPIPKPSPETLADDSAATHEDPELVKLSMLPTIAGDRIPEDVRQAARSRLMEERSPLAPSILPENEPAPETVRTIRVPDDLRAAPQVLSLADEKTSAIGWDAGKQELSRVNAWERAKQRLGTTDAKPGRAPQPDLRVIRTPPPEGTPAPLPEVRSQKQAPKTVPEVLVEASEVQPVPVAESGKETPKNAWGDSPSRVQPSPAQIAGWGEPSARPGARDSKKEERNGRALEARDPRLGLTQPPAHVISVHDLAKRAVDPALAVLQDPDGDFATSIRLFSTKLEEFMRTLGYRAYMLTSAEPFTGKTTAACNLAFALAEDTHRRVALVEANFRNPRFADIFGISEGQGLIPLLEGRVQIAETIVKISDRNLVIMPSGGKYPHPGELLASPRFKMLISELANTVDIAVVDAPPVSPHADANMLLPLLDAAVLVVAEGQTRVNWVAEAGQQLGMTRIIGGVYNKIPRGVLKDLKPELKTRLGV